MKKIFYGLAGDGLGRASIYIKLMIFLKNKEAVKITSIVKKMGRHYLWSFTLLVRNKWRLGGINKKINCFQVAIT